MPSVKIAGEGRLQEILLQINITQIGTSLFSLFLSAYVDDIQMAGRKEPAYLAPTLLIKKFLLNNFMIKD